MPSSLPDLLRYYLECLRLERRGDVARTAGELQRGVFALPPALPAGWGSLLASPAAQAAAQAARSRESLSLVFGPVVQHDAAGRHFEPVAAIYCASHSQALRPEPADVWLGSALAGETDEAELARLRADLEQAARQGPGQFRAAVVEAMRAQGMPAPSPCAAVADLKDLESGCAADMPALWLVEEETSYDRGLVRELNELLSSPVLAQDALGTALAALLDPPAAAQVADTALLQALDNPAALTFSQAMALAACTGPLTVVTGPPGTGKTRLIAALIVQHLAEQRSVLVASKINMAVESAVGLVERMLGRGAILRTGNAEAREDLAAQATWLAGLQTWQADGELFGAPQPAGAPGAGGAVYPLVHLGRSAARIGRLAASLERHGEAPVAWWQWLTRARLRGAETEWQRLLGAADGLFEGQPMRRAARCGELRGGLDGLVQRTHPHLAHLPTALQNDSRSRRRAFAHFAELGFPVAVTNLAVSSNIALEPAIFDTLVVDEASTCDPASLLPLLYRARRAVIVGDPQQLPHITGRGWRQVEPVPVLRGADGSAVSAEFGKSAFQLCAEVAGPRREYLLTDHFRCPPAIIGLSNEAFYGGSLRIHSPEREEPVRLRLVPGRHVMTRAGSRTNDAQVAAGIEELCGFAAAAPGARLGLVAPYRAAADRALALAAHDEALAPLLQGDRLAIGTAHRFQGNEVDCLVFVTVAGENAAERELKWVEEPHLFNVAVTRARRQLVVVAEPTLWERGALPLTRKLLSAAAVMVRAGQSPVGDVVARVAAVLDVAHVPYRTGCTFRGYPVDVLDAADPPRWALRVHTWTGLKGLDLAHVLQLWDDERALRGWGVEVLNVNPLNAVSAVSRWLAERELSGR